MSAVQCKCLYNSGDDDDYDYFMVVTILLVLQLLLAWYVKILLTLRFTNVHFINCCFHDTFSACVCDVTQCALYLSELAVGPAFACRPGQVIWFRVTSAPAFRLMSRTCRGFHSVLYTVT